MKVPSDRQASDVHYAPYPLPGGSPTFAHPAPPATNRKQSRTSSSAPSPSPGNGASAAASGGGGNGEETQYKVARAISSCTRCRSRKQKCDGKLPACSACERAKVECIGFDAISKTNISRNYLHQLEQEVTTLRAQVAVLSSNGLDPLTQQKQRFANNASQAVSSFSRPGAADLMIDPALAHEGPDSSLRSPWDSPSYFSGRRHSDYPFPNTPNGLDSPRSPYLGSRAHPTGQPANILTTSLTRMVHDAALRTGHAQNNNVTLNPPAPSSLGSDKGSHDSPIGVPIEGEGTSPNDAQTPRTAAANRRPPSSSPLATNASISSGKSSAKRRQFAVPPLPPQPAVERLVAAYVDFVGVTAPIIHIPSLGKQLIKLREGRDVEQSDIFVVMMVLALSTMASSRFVDPPDELRACSEAFHAEAMKHLDAVFEEQSYVGLQAILLLVWYSLLNPDKGSIWFLVGLASRTCVDLGFHNESNSPVDQLDSLELDMRRRLFWCTYKMDRLLCQALGRPPSIPDGFIHVAPSSLLHDVDIHANHYGVLTGETCSYKKVFFHTTKLRQLQSEILTHTYGIWQPDGTIKTPEPEWFDDCFERLKTWLSTAPEPRGTVSTEGYAISFHNSVLLLFRPSRGNPRPGRQALSTVLASSSYIIRIYRRMQLNNRISWLWMTSHFSFMAGLSFLYAFFNLYSVGGGTGVPTLEEAMMDVESCLAVLEYLTPRVPSAGACHDTMQNLSKAILDQLSDTARPSSNVNSPAPRGVIRGAPISSSRDDPLPNPNESFPAPLPLVALPYELSLLDNLFVNPMAPHNKASDYTNGNKARCQKKLANEVRSAVSNGNGAEPTISNMLSSGTGISLDGGYPPNAFGGNGATGSGGGISNISGVQAYGMAAQVGSTPAAQGGLGDSSSRLAGGGGAPTPGNGNGAGDLGLASGAGNDPNGFDLFSFLMDEEGGLGGAGMGNWDALDVPADFSLWS